VLRTGLVWWHKPNSVPAFARWRSFISLGFPSAQLGCDYYPRGSSRIRGKKRAGNPPSALSCTTWGFSCGSAYANARWALTPPFHPYPTPPAPPSPSPQHFQLSPKNRSAVLILSESGTGWAWVGRVVPGGIFSVTLSVTQDFGSRVPPISRGMPPFGVRTFLWQNKGQASDHPPQPAK
jgi:hypothetical protein